MTRFVIPSDSRPYIDGLRAVAALAVVFHNLPAALLPGTYVGGGRLLRHLRLPYYPYHQPRDGAGPLHLCELLRMSGATHLPRAVCGDGRHAGHFGVVCV